MGLKARMARGKEAVYQETEGNSLSAGTAPAHCTSYILNILPRDESRNMSQSGMWNSLEPEECGTHFQSEHANNLAIHNQI